MAALFVLYAALAAGHAFSAVPWCDEAWLSNPALTFLRKGYFGTPILTEFGWGPPESLLHIDRKTYWVMPLHMLLQAGWYHVFGYSLWTLRSLSIVWGAVALAGLGSLVRRLTGDGRVALLTIVIAGTDYFLLTRFADGRMDAMAVALMLLAFAVYLSERERRLTLAVLGAGVCAAGCAFTHPVGGFFALCGLAFFGWRFDRRRLRFGHLVLFGVPFLVLGAGWAAYIAQDLPAFRQQLAGNAQGRWEGITDLRLSIYREFRFKYFQAFGLNSYQRFSLQNFRLLLLGTYAGATAAALFWKSLRARPGVRTLAGLTAFFVLGGLLFDGAKRWYYLIYVVPFFAALLAALLLFLADRYRARRGLVYAAGTLFLLLQIGGTAIRVAKNDYRGEFLPAANVIVRGNPNHEAVDGEGQLGFVLGFPSYLTDDLSLGFYTRARAKWLFIPDTYWGLWQDNIKWRDLAVYQHIQRTLRDDYRLVFSNAHYRVYERKA